MAQACHRALRILEAKCNGSIRVSLPPKQIIKASDYHHLNLPWRSLDGIKVNARFGSGHPFEGGVSFFWIRTQDSIRRLHGAGVAQLFDKLVKSHETFVGELQYEIETKPSVDQSGGVTLFPYESALIALEFNNNILPSSVIRDRMDQSSGAIDLHDVVSELRRLLSGLSESMGRDHAPSKLRVILIHTHPGHNTVLNMTDNMGALLIEKVVRDFWPNGSLEVLSFVLPIGNWSEDRVVFEDGLVLAGGS